MALVWLVYVAAQGGDNMVGGRMIVPVLPLVYVALAALSAGITTLRPKRKALALAALVGLFIAGYAFDRGLQQHVDDWRFTFVQRYETSQYLRRTFPKSALVALNPAGIIPFYSEIAAIDMLGLNDEYIAHSGKRDLSLRYGHQAGDGQYVLSRRPDVILFGSAASQLPGPFISDQEIWNSPDFKKKLSPGQLVQFWLGVC